MAVYLADMHNLVKAMEKSDVCFPATKQELIKKFGSSTVQIDFDKSVTAASIVEALDPEKFPSATAFFCAYSALCMDTLKKKIKY